MHLQARDNALKYSDTNLIRISAREEKDGILISVQDNGMVFLLHKAVVFSKFASQDGHQQDQKDLGCFMSSGLLNCIKVLFNWIAD
jgi:K+-sensing histidine kinase KdpD